MPEVVACADGQDLVNCVTERFVAHATACYERGQKANVVLTGGRVAASLYANLALALVPLPHVVSIIEWWWGDERFVAARDSDRNEHAAWQLLGEPLGVDPNLWHAMPAADQGLTLEQAAVSYCSELERLENCDHGEVVKFEVVLLGLGEDGHVASLFPGHIWDPSPPVIAVSDSPKPPPLRLTLTPRRLAESQNIWLLASGEAKAPAVASLLAGTRIPAQLLDLDQTTLFADQSALSLS
jgi:6-phosphogluconolactonase